MAEILDIYDINRNKIQKVIERKDEIELDAGEYLLTVQCWIINSDGSVLLTQRRLDKFGGGKWEPTGGLAQSGENSIEAITRELREEIGLKIGSDNINLFRTNKTDRLFIDVYTINKDVKLEEINFADGEVIDAKYVTFEELNTMINNGKSFEHLRWFIEAYRN